MIGDQKMKKVILIVLDSLGIGALPDAHLYGDSGANTLLHTLDHNPGINLPNLANLGLGQLIEHDQLKATNLSDHCCYGRMMAQSKGKDTTSGHWEMAGILTKEEFPVYPEGFPTELMTSIEKATGTKFLGNEVASGTEIIERLGPRQQLTGHPIIYTSADSVLQIAGHEEIIPLSRLYDICSTIRQLLLDPPHRVGRIIARPFIGEEGNYQRTANRRDYSLIPPKENLLSDLYKQGKEVVALGKIEDIFAGQGVSRAVHTLDNQDGVNQLLKNYPQLKEGLIFVNLVDFDSKYGHRRNAQGYGQALEAFDKQIPGILNLLDEETLLMITADHGCDPTAPGSDHTREYVPILCYGSMVNQTNLKTRKTFGDLGATIGQYLEVAYSGIGVSFLNQMKS